MVQAHRRGGFTLIELLVVVSVIGLLVALLLPAVQSARGSARRMQCANNLRQIGLAIQNHAEAHGKFPAGVGRYPADVSFLVQILPQLEQAALHNSINVSDGVAANENLTAFRMAPGLFICPADASRSAIDTEGAVNYAGNVGWPSRIGDGVFIGKPLRPAEITDGLSQTVGVSEWIVGPGLGRGRRENTSKYRLLRLYSDRTADIEGFARDCDALTDVDDRFGYPSKGQFWLEGSLGTTLYNHTLPPNRHSCSADFSMDATTAGSYHGGANALSMDGSVRLVKDTIDRRVWAAAGTRAGAEVEAALD
jgi:prepilin-type N-terminal cleavage/methylation domain-containing protein